MQFSLMAAENNPKEIPFVPGVYLFTVKLDINVVNTTGSPISCTATLFGGVFQTLASVSSPNVPDGQSHQDSSFTFATVGVVSSPYLLLSTSGPSSVVAYICTEKIG